MHRLATALLALSILGALDVSLAAQSEAQFTSLPPTAASARPGSFRNRRGGSVRAGESSGTIRASQMALARQQHAAMPLILPAGSTSFSSPWQPIGPAQVVSPYYGKVTGRITSISIDPSDPTANTVYVGTTGGGVWKSTNAAGDASQVVFAPLTDTIAVFSTGKIASLSIGAVSVQPGGTSVVLAGTGDPNDALDSYYGSGLLRSKDRGATWNLIQQSTDPSHYSFIGEGFAGFAWGTTNPNLVVAAVSEAAEGSIINAQLDGISERGLYYSTDAGASWLLATITDGPDKPIQSSNHYGWVGVAVTDVVWNPVRKSFYAAIRYHGYYDSPDGMTWTRMANQPGPQLASIHCPITPGAPGSYNCPIFRGALAVQPVTGDLFAFTVDRNNRDIGLWWDQCNRVSGGCATPVSFQKQIATTALDTVSGSIVQGTYNQWLKAVPSQSDTLLFAGTVDIFRCSLLNGCQWRNTTHSISCASARVSPSQHAADFLPGQLGQPFPGLMYFGNDGGLWRTTNGVNQQSPACSPDDATSFDNLNSSIGSLSEINGLAQDPTNPSVFLASLGANGTAAPANAGDTAWPQILSGEGDTTAIDPINPQNWYTTSGPGVAINRCTVGQACQPANFAQPAIGETQVANDGQTLAVPAAFMLDTTDPSQMLVGTCRVWRGYANGSGWSSSNVISKMLDGAQEPACNGNTLIRSLAASPSPTGEWLYAGMEGRYDGFGLAPGHIFRAQWSRGVASPWTDLTFSPLLNGTQPFNPGAFAISSIVPDPHDATGQTVYVTIEGFSGNGISAALVYRSTDAGAHWTNINSNLPLAPANSLVVDPLDANTLYAALDTGVYVTQQVTGCSNQFINCWSVYGTGLPNAPVTQLLAFNGPTPMLRAGTYGRGIWQIPLASAQSSLTAATLTPSTITFGDTPLQTTTAARSVTVLNTGTQALLITQVTINGDFVQQNSCPASLPALGSCSIQVSFTPSQLGNRTGTLSVYGNIPNGQLTGALSGNGARGGDILLLPSAMDFATITVGATSATQFLTVSNMGGSTISLGVMKVGAPFAITANTCGASLAPTYGCTVGLAFSPTASGLVSAAFTVTDDAGTQSAPLTGRGATPATDLLSPLSLAFAPQVLATNSAPQMVTMTNNGDTALMLIRAQTTGDFSVTNDCGASLAGHSSCAFAVVFHPSLLGAQSGLLTVTELVGSHTIPLNGTGLAPMGISIAPSSLDFGGVGVGGSSSLPVTLTNNSGVPLGGIAFAVTGDFALATNTCGSNLAAWSACSLQVVFSPLKTGPGTGNLTVTTSSATNFNVPLNGNGMDFQLVVVGLGSATVVTGQTANYALSLVPVIGSSGVVTFSCAGAPKNSTCVLSPLSAQVTGGNTVSIAVTVVTGIVSTASSTPATHLPPGNGKALGAGVLVLALLLPLGLTRRGSRAIWLVLLVCVTIVPLGCGVGVSGGNPSTAVPVGPVNSTPAGTYTLTVTAAATGIQRTATLKLTVD